LTYRITFAVTGRARFLSHLETVDTLLSALRRGGYDIALSRGMKPKPVISLALPRAVGVESEAELADVELVAAPSPDDVAAALAPQLPGGFTVRSVERGEGRRASSRVQSIRYLVEVADTLDWEEAIHRFLAAGEALVTRQRLGKADKQLDVRKFCSAIDRTPAGLRIELELSGQGTARPEEVVHAVAARVGATPTISRIVRTAIELRDLPVGVPT
jgi:radical SAM-linked protein